MHRTSAVIPVENTPEALLRETVQSALEQTDWVLKVLVIDDGSRVPLTLKENGIGVVQLGNSTDFEILIQFILAKLPLSWVAAFRDQMALSVS